MKKVLYFTMAMVFTLAFGAAYANEGAKTGASELYNGITDFSGKACDRGEIECPGPSAQLEGAGAGGQGRVKVLYNGLTDFSGFKTEAPGAAGAVEGAGAGGGAGKKPYNGITDFSGTANDRGPAPVMPVKD